MNLESFFREMGDFLSGKVHHEEAAKRLYGQEGEKSQDAERLVLYSLIHRKKTLGTLDCYSKSKWAVRRSRGEEAWKALGERYLEASPTRSFQYPHLHQDFPDFLEDHCEELGLPKWLPELADFELWERSVRSALDSGEDPQPDEGPLRLAPSVELRDYQHDFPEWLAVRPEERPEAPIPRKTIVIFWRDRHLNMKVAKLAELELRVVRAVWRGEPVSADPNLGITHETFDACVSQLRQDGIVLGVRLGNAGDGSQGVAASLSEVAEQNEKTKGVPKWKRNVSDRRLRLFSGRA